jgi:hypothetical protein
MTRGRLKAIGTSLKLKNKFGDGYRVSMMVPRGSDVPSVKLMITSTVPSAVLLEEEYIGASANKPGDSAASAVPASPGATSVSVDTSGQTARVVFALKDIKEVKKIVRVLEEDQQLHAKDGSVSKVSGWGLSQTSLEDVFLQMIK